jgi:hypothetical protein
MIEWYCMSLVRHVLWGAHRLLPNTVGPVWNRALAKQEAGVDATCETIETIKEILGVRLLGSLYSCFVIVGSMC